MDLKAGERVIVFRCREAQAKLDQFLLTNSFNYVPARPMPETPEYLVPAPAE